MNRKHCLAILAAAALSMNCFASPAWAGELPAAVQTKVDKAKKYLVQLAANPVVVAAVRESNTRDAADMTNGKWLDLNEADPYVKAILTSKVSTMIAKWEKDDDTVNKILLRDQKGRLVGASVRPLLYNNASRPVFANALKGQVWAADEIKPDTSTQIPSVHVSVPVLDGGKPIGVLHAGVTAN